MNKAKKVLEIVDQSGHAKSKVMNLDNDTKRALENTDIDAVLYFLADTAVTRSGDTRGTEPELSAKWLETGRLLKNLISQLPIVHR